MNVLRSARDFVRPLDVVIIALIVVPWRFGRYAFAAGLAILLLACFTFVFYRLWRSGELMKPAFIFFVITTALIGGHFAVRHFAPSNDLLIVLSLLVAWTSSLFFVVGYRRILFPTVFH